MIVHQFLIILTPDRLKGVFLPLYYGSLGGTFGPLCTLGRLDLLIPLLVLCVPLTDCLLPEYHHGLTQLVLRLLW